MAAEMTLEQHAQEIMQQQGFVMNSTLQFGTWYNGNQRSLVYAGIWQGRAAVLKVYNEDLPARQPEDLLLFDSWHTSNRMHVPELFVYEVESPNAGWMITELIPERAKMLRSPLSAEARALFLDAFVEYRSTFPLEAPEGRVLDPRYFREDEQMLTAGEFHRARIARWRVLAEKADGVYMKNGQAALLSDEVRVLCERAQEKIDEVFADQPLYWCHGHFKPNEIHFDEVSREFWVTDFAHMTLYPRGYEFAFMIWADALMEFGSDAVNLTDIVQSDPAQKRIAEQEVALISEEGYVARVQEWITMYCEYVEEANLAKTGLVDEVQRALVLEREVMIAALCERVLGAIYADMIARVEIPYEQKLERVRLLSAVLKMVSDDKFLSAQS